MRSYAQVVHDLNSAVTARQPFPAVARFAAAAAADPDGAQPSCLLLKLQQMIHLHHLRNTASI